MGKVSFGGIDIMSGKTSISPHTHDKALLAKTIKVIRLTRTLVTFYNSKISNNGNHVCR